MPLLSNKTRVKIQNLLDGLISEFGKDCQLLFPALKEDCPNCVFDPTTNRSSGRYKVGGPRPFPNGTICPVCRGAGQLETEHTEMIKVLCQWNPRNMTVLSTTNLTTPNSIVRTKGYITDLPKVMQAKRMIMQLPIAPYIKATFQLMGNPVDESSIIQNRYFVIYWKQVE